MQGGILLVELVIGKAKTKTEYIKNKISDTDKPVILLDYKNYYQDIEGKRIDLGLINPLLEPLSYKDVSAINAGAAEYQNYLLNRAEQVLRDYTPAGNSWEKYRYQNLIDESLQRCLSSWNNNEMQNTASLKRHLTFKKSIQTNSMSDAISATEDENVIILETNGLHSRETRILTFLFLSRFLEEKGSFSLVSDNINNIWRNGHLFNFIKAFDFNKIDAVFSFNKTDNVANILKNYINKITIFQLDSNKDFRDLKAIQPSIPEKVKKLKSNEHFSLRKEVIQ